MFSISSQHAFFWDPELERKNTSRDPWMLAYEGV